MSIKLTLRPDPETQILDDGFFYGLNNGSIRPSRVLADDRQVEAVVAAVDLLDQLYDLMDDNDLLEIV